MGVLSVVPSPYQRDLFAALAARPEVDLEVYYQEDAVPESPWPAYELAPYESVLSGFWLGSGPRRLYINWNLPNFRAFDVVILNTSYLSLATQWLMRAGLGETPWVVWAERLRAQDSKIKRAAQRLLTAPFGGASAIAAIGTLARRQYQQRFPDQRVVNIPYHCDLSAYRRVAGQSSSGEGVTFLFCGQMIHRKGVDLLLRAFESLVADGLDVRLVLVGREAELPEMMGDVGTAARGRIAFEGFQDPEDLPRYFGQADVFVLPSRHDGWGVVVNEALGAGLPLICSKAVGAAHDLVRPGENGVVVSPGEEEPLRKAMMRIARDDALRQSWRRTSREDAAHWTPSEGAKKWTELVESVV
ncbi:glycosyltransferase family 4 protein [Salinibacter pepae]|uniref:glycosyltransferase family 4 protein n=1 Tax=Salinibacter pepae TaxID=3040382 RepID=UPI0021E91576|nr:glycosyltransferase family 4 protein [Salinibacter pepae]